MTRRRLNKRMLPKCKNSHSIPEVTPPPPRPPMPPTLRKRRRNVHRRLHLERMAACNNLPENGISPTAAGVRKRLQVATLVVTPSPSNCGMAEELNRGECKYRSTAASFHPMLVWCWARVGDGGPVSNQHWFNVSCLLGSCRHFMAVKVHFFWEPQQWSRIKANFLFHNYVYILYKKNSS